MTDRQRQLIDDYLLIENAQERLSAIVERAGRQPRLAESERSDAHRVPGCVSPVWLVPGLVGGLCRFRGDAEGPLVRGLVALLCAYYSDTAPAEILADDTDPLAALGLLRDLSPTRQNGLAAVRAAIRAFARSL